MKDLSAETLCIELLTLSSLAALTFFVLLVAYKKGFFKWTATSHQHPLYLVSHNVLISFGIYFLLSLLLPPFLQKKLVSLFPTSPLALSTLTNFFSSLSILLGEGIYLFSLAKKTREQVLKTGEASILQDLTIGTTSWIIVFPATLLFDQLVELFLFPLFSLSDFPDQVAISYLKTVLREPFYFVITAFFMTIIGPFFEELLFRGFLQTWLKGWVGKGPAILGSALIFSLFHFSLTQKWGNVPILGGLFILGLMLGFLYERQRSLYAPLALHCLFNSISILTLILTMELSV